MSWGGYALRGLLESLAVSVLIGLQREVPLAALAWATTACTLPRPSFGRWRSPAGFRPFVAQPHNFLYVPLFDAICVLGNASSLLERRSPIPDGLATRVVPRPLERRNSTVRFSRSRRPELLPHVERASGSPRAIFPSNDD